MRHIVSQGGAMLSFMKHMTGGFHETPARLPEHRTCNVLRATLEPRQRGLPAPAGRVAHRSVVVPGPAHASSAVPTRTAPDAAAAAQSDQGDSQERQGRFGWSVA